MNKPTNIYNCATALGSEYTLGPNGTPAEPGVPGMPNVASLRLQFEAVDR